MKTHMQLIKFYCKNVPKLPHLPLYTSNIYRALSVHQPLPWALGWSTDQINCPSLPGEGQDSAVLMYLGGVGRTLPAKPSAPSVTS